MCMSSPRATYASDFRLFITTPALLVVCVVTIWIGVCVHVRVNESVLLTRVEEGVFSEGVL